MSSFTPVSFSRELLNDIGMLGRKGVQDLAQRNYEARMNRILQDVLEVWKKHEMKLFEAMDLVVNLQLHCNRQIVQMTKGNLPSIGSENMLPYAPSQPAKD